MGYETLLEQIKAVCTWNSLSPISLGSTQIYSRLLTTQCEYTGYGLQ